MQNPNIAMRMFHYKNKLFSILLLAVRFIILLNAPSNAPMLRGVAKCVVLDGLEHHVDYLKIIVLKFQD